MGALKKAQTLWERALRLDPKNVWIRKNINRVRSELAGVVEEEQP